MIRTEETEAIRHRIATLKEKIENKEAGIFEYGTTLQILRDALADADNELQQLINPFPGLPDQKE